jgi:flagellar protein FliS
MDHPATSADKAPMHNDMDASREYFRSAVMTASPEQLQLMLLDGAIRFTTRGMDAIKAGRIEEAAAALDRARRIMVAVTDGLRREVNPQLVDQLTALYAFIYRRLVEGSLYRNVSALEDALKILRHQRETWALLVERLRQHDAACCAAAGPAPAQAAPGQTPSFVAEA